MFSSNAGLFSWRRFLFVAVILHGSLLSTLVEAALYFNVFPSPKYVQEGQTVSLHWTYGFESGDSLAEIIWMSYDPPGSSNASDQFRLAVKSRDGSVVYFPDKPKGVNLYEGRVAYKDHNTLEITNVTLDNCYHCGVPYRDYNGDNKFALSELVRVIPTLSPQIINSSFSSPLDVIEGDDVIVNCSATGKPAPSVTWTNSGSNAQLNQSVSSVLLVIQNIRRDSNKDYTCTANSTGVENTVSKNLKLNVLYAPSVTAKSPKEVYANSENTLVCIANGKPTPTITWTYDSQPVTTNIKDDGNKSTLTLSSVTKHSDGERYTCTATNSQGTDSATIVLEFAVMVPPIVIQPVVASHYIRGNRVNVTCDTIGVPTPTVQWIRIKDYYKYPASIGVSYLGFDPIDKGDAGKYKCKATNRAGNDEATADVVVYYTPSVTAEGPIKKHASSENTLVCIADGKPTPTITWTKDSQPITTNIKEDGNKSTLTLSSVTKHSDGERYTCTATNSQGTDSALIVLEFAVMETNVPPTVSYRGQRSCTNTAVCGSVIAVLVVFNVLQLLYVIWVRRRMAANDRDKRLSNDVCVDSGTCAKPADTRSFESKSPSSSIGAHYTPLVPMTRN